MGARRGEEDPRSLQGEGNHAESCAQRPCQSQISTCVHKSSPSLSPRDRRRKLCGLAPLPSLGGNGT